MLSKNVMQELQEERAWLSKLIARAEESLRNCPEGSVRISEHGNEVQFYHRLDTRDKNGRYITAENRKIAHELIQKRYLERAIVAADKQRRALDCFLERYNKDALAEVYVKEGKKRGEYLRAMELPDEEFIRRWQNVNYTAKEFSEFTPEHYTSKGERVRSKSEVIIANSLSQFEIPYRYECPIRLSGAVIHPDFTILRMSDRKEIYWEHLGMMDEPEYRNHAFRRIREYEKNGIYPGERLIITVETGKLPLNAAIVENMILHDLKK